ncbi:MAG TPA: 2-hydroxychromene-2-carboxylate isomerase [Burkholderiaceae bacterium]|nr:2-hydroxychromene-2-carboxylate isomerase [Burkholderiaceae bacterium]
MTTPTLPRDDRAIDFWFDFSSPYGYFAAQSIDALAARYGRDVRWHAILLGVIFKATGARPLSDVPLKGAYVLYDWQRISRLTGIEYHQPSSLPISSVAAARAFLFARNRDPALAKRVARALYRAYFVEQREIQEPAVVVDVCEREGLPRAEVEQALGDERIKQALRDEVAQAEACGVFGSPFIVADGEPYFGWDRLPMLEAALARRSSLSQ